MATVAQTESHQEANRKEQIPSSSPVLQFSRHASCWKSLTWTSLEKQKWGLHCSPGPLRQEENERVRGSQVKYLAQRFTIGHIEKMPKCVRVIVDGSKGKW